MENEDMKANCCSASPGPCQGSRISMAELLRGRARIMRDRAHAVEGLADEIGRRSFSPVAEQVLWEVILASPLLNC